jgi:hypothetical protein
MKRERMRGDGVCCPVTSFWWMTRQFGNIKKDIFEDSEFLDENS